MVIFAALMKKITVTFIFLLFFAAGQSQTRIEGAFSTGVLVEHHANKMAALAKERPYALELGVSRQTGSNQAWAASYNYPRYGVSLLFLSPGNPEDIGQIYGLIPNMRFSFLRRNYLFDPGLRIGVGAGYVTKPFDPNTNYKNIILSSHWNAAVSFGFDLEARLPKQLALRSSIGIVHFSNGATKIPNYGINLFVASIGLSYAFSAVEQPCFVHRAPAEKVFIGGKKEQRRHLDIFLTGGPKENRVLFDGEKYAVATVSTEGSYRYVRQAAVGVGVDLSYDWSERKEILKENGVSIAEWQALKPGLAVHHEFFFGRLSAFTQLGAYIHLNKYNTQTTYQRFALRYTAGDRLRLHLGVKSFGLAADSMEFGLGFRIL